MLKLIIYLKDGREVSGVYHWSEALKKLKVAAAEPSFLDFHFAEASNG